MRIFATILFLVLFTVVVVFMVMNAHMVQVRVGPKIYKVHLFTVVLASLATGIVLSYIIGFFEQLSLRLKNRRLRKELKDLKEEVDSLRNMPLGDSSTQN